MFFSFKPGSFLSVHLFLHSGSSILIQGLCIKKSLCGLNSSFTIKQIVDGVPVFHTFPLFSPFIHSISVNAPRSGASKSFAP
jgi:ribosomal protein L19